MTQIYALQELVYGDAYGPPFDYVASRGVAEQIIAGLIGKPCGQYEDGKLYRGLWREDDFDIAAIDVRE